MRAKISASGSVTGVESRSVAKVNTPGAARRNSPNEIRTAPVAN